MFSKKLSIAFLAVLFVFGCSDNQDSTSDTTVTTTPKTKVAKQFKRLTSAETGIEFKNNLVESFEYNYYKFQYLYNGGGVAIGDINNDGLEDLYFTATMYSNKLYLNKGNLQFEDISQSSNTLAGGGTKTGVTMVDINGDGLLDIYVCRTGKENQKETRSNLFYINNGDNTFTDKAKEMGLGEFCYSNHANFFDYDNDGDLDLYLMNHPVDFTKESRPKVKVVNGIYQRITSPDNPHESDRFYRNNGNGTFTDVSSQAGISNRAFGLSVTVSDVNQDGWMDVFVANDYDEPDMLYINQKNGKFIDESDRYFKHMSQNSMGSDFGDLNNDGLQDLMVLDMLPEDNRRQKSLMTKMVYDRVEQYANQGYGYQYMRNVVQLNNGNNSFSEIGELTGMSSTDWSWGALMADYNNDGWKDLFIANGIRRDFTNMDYLKFTKNTFSQNTNASSIYEFLNQIPTEKVKNYFYKNNGDLTFKNLTYEWGISEVSYSNGAAYGDLDNDGDLDLVINNIDDEVFVYKNQGETIANQNYLQVQFNGDKNNTKGIGASVKIETEKGIQYQEMTPTHGYFSSSPYKLYFGLGAINTVTKLTVVWPNGKVQVLNDVAANSTIILNQSEATNQQIASDSPKSIFKKQDVGIDFKHQENDFVDFKREPLLPHELSKEGPALATADVNGDGLTDVFIGGASGQKSTLYIQNASAKFTAQPFELNIKQEDVDAVFFDADGDQDQDLYIVCGGNHANGGIYQDRLMINDGAGNFTKGELPTMNSSGGAVTVGDIDGDGDMDIFVGGRVLPTKYPYAPPSYLLKNEGGKFTDITPSNLSKVGMVTDAVFADVDGDNQQDLVIVGEWMPVSVFKNTNGQFEEITEQMGLGKSNGWWHSIAIQDMDDDGDADIIAGNQGLNHRLKPSISGPIEVVAKDFDGNGAIDPVLSYYQNGTSYPLAQRDMLVSQLRFLQKKFNKYTPYATAPMNKVFSADELSGAKKEKAYTFANTYFENEGGKYSAKNLPNEAQISPIRSSFVLDINADGVQDIIAVGNNYNIEVEGGRQDAGRGVVMLGNNDGTFSSLSVKESGLYAAKNARKATQIKLANGKSLLIVVNNDDVVETFEY